MSFISAHMSAFPALCQAPAKPSSAEATAARPSFEGSNPFRSTILTRSALREPQRRCDRSEQPFQPVECASAIVKLRDSGEFMPNRQLARSRRLALRHSAPLLFAVATLLFWRVAPVGGDTLLAMSMADRSFHGVSASGDFESTPGRRQLSADGQWVVFQSQRGVLLVPGYSGAANNSSSPTGSRAWSASSPQRRVRRRRQRTAGASCRPSAPMVVSSPSPANPPISSPASPVSSPSTSISGIGTRILPARRDWSPTGPPEPSKGAMTFPAMRT